VHVPDADSLITRSCDDLEPSKQSVGGGIPGEEAFDKAYSSNWRQ
jgi:hypothetical protein